MVGKEFEGGKYHKLIAKGDITKVVVVQEWIKIWNSNLKRAYTADFEIYGENAGKMLLKQPINVALQGK